MQNVSQNKMRDLTKIETNLSFLFAWNNYLYISPNFRLHFSHKSFAQTSKQLPKLNFQDIFFQQLSLSLSSSFHNYSHGLTIPSFEIKASRKFEKGKEKRKKKESKEQRKTKRTGLHKSVEDERKLNCTSNIRKRCNLLTSLDNSKLSN